jgi:hypothetical protein
MLLLVCLIQADGSAAALGPQVWLPALSNQYDLMGDTSPSAVSNSQLHYGQDVRTFIEDQPLTRGSVLWNALTQSAQYWDIKLLVRNYTQNDFGDTHSLVLIVDSLSVQNTLMQLIPASQRDASAKQAIGELLKMASNAYAAFDSDQGAADGESLNNIVNALPTPSAGAKSQWHIGTDVREFIEDQPLYRGGVAGAAALISLENFGVKLLVNGYLTKDFGDTPSLVLLVDSLAVQNTLLQLVAPALRDAAAGALGQYLQDASNLRKQDGALVAGADYLHPHLLAGR